MKRTTSKKTSIILVDDDKDMCTSLRDVLELEPDMRARYSTDPLKALEMIEREKFQIAVLDYKMPGMNGIELLEKIKKISPSTKVFLLTAFLSEDLIEEAETAGAEEVMSKFIWPADIIKTLRESS